VVHKLGPFHASLNGPSNMWITRFAAAHLGNGEYSKALMLARPA
jgi:hypothetical protein